MNKIIKQKSVFQVIKVFIRKFSMEQQNTGCSLKKVISELETFAPLSLAEKWDNVGLLIEPYIERPIKTIFLTNDLTLPVLNEAVKKNVDMIISYHPPIFTGLKRITKNQWKEKIVLKCIASGIALYSPHTAWDVTLKGTSDWLASSLPFISIQPIKIDPVTKSGPGRIMSLMDQNVTLAKAIECVQNHIGLDVQVAVGVDHSMETLINTAAVCPGSGASLLKDVEADLYISGEMSHHEILDAQQRNVSVILCNHSNSERGFLKVFKSTLCNMLDGNCNVVISEFDKDPLSISLKKN